jgi:hypothetical protein
MRVDKIPIKGAAGLVFVVGVVAITLIYIPASRWFLALSVLAGVIVAGVLRLMRRDS